MEQFLNLILPFFLVIGLGYVAGYFSWLPESAAPILTRFVMYFALPAMMFQILAKAPFEEITNYRFFTTYTVGAIAIFSIAFLLFRFFHKETYLNSAYFAQACAMPNTGYLGIPMLVGILGPKAAIPITLCLITELLVIAPLTIMVVGKSANQETNLLQSRKALMGMLKKIVTNPLILAAFVCVWAAFFELQLPGFADNTIRILSDGAAPVALFTIGLSLAQRYASEQSQGDGRAHLKTEITMSALKLLVHPLLIYTLVFVLVDIEPLFATTAVLVAAMPIAANAFMLAAETPAREASISKGILISSCVAVVSFTLILNWIQSAS